MRSVRQCVRLCLLLMGLVAFCDPVTAQLPEVPPIENLKRARFQHVVMNRDETLILTATNTIAQLWDLRTGALFQTFEGHRAPITTVCFSPDEQQILTGSGKNTEHGPENSTVRLWDTVTGKSVCVLPALAENPLGKDEQPISGSVCLAKYSPNGNQVFAIVKSRCGGESDGVIVWNMETRNIDLALFGICTYTKVTTYMSRGSESVHFSPDGQWLTGLYSDGSQVGVWDARTGQLRWKAECPDHPLEKDQVGGFQSVQVSSDGSLILAACSDRAVRVWEAATGREVQTLRGHTDDITVARFLPNPEGEQIVTASRDKTVRVWDIRSGQALKQLDHPGSVYPVSISQDGQRILTQWFQVTDPIECFQTFARLWDSKTGQRIYESDVPPTRINFQKAILLGAYQSSIFSPSGRTVLTSVRNADGSGEVGDILIDAETGSVKKTYSNSPR
ncbi:MAG: WD40 repeat domain-containing protein [Planctomycetaceae bacterium]